MSNKQIPVSLQQNIFKDFGWAKPELKGLRLTLENNKAPISWNNAAYTLLKEQDGFSLKNENGFVAAGKNNRSHSDMYYDMSALTLKPVMRSRWVSYQTYTTQMVSVPHTRSVTRYVYDSYSKTSKPVYSMETYYSYETRMVPRTDWRWENYTVYELDIPDYEYYAFTMPDSTNLIIYDAKGGPYLQNASYLSAIDKDGINHVLIDANNNGTFLDQEDRIMFNSWNPYSKDSKYRPMRLFRENSWYGLAFLKNENFLTFSQKNGQLNLEYENDQYANSKEKGSVIFSGLPEKATLIINGQEFKTSKKDKVYKSEYGLFNARIVQKGKLDYETTYTVNKTSRLWQLPLISTAGQF
jgi:hypothetical protein